MSGSKTGKIKHPRAIAKAEAEALRDRLKPYTYCDPERGYMIDIAGSIRRNKPKVGDIDIVMVLDPDTAGELISILYDAGADVKQKQASWITELKSGPIEVELFFTDPPSYAATLLTRTGPAKFNIRMRTMAKRLGLKLNRYGLYSRFSDAALQFETELQYFNAVGLKWLPPSKRDGV